MQIVYASSVFIIYMQCIEGNKILHLPVTMNAEEKINICADILSLHQEQLPAVSVLQHAAKNFADCQIDFPFSQYIAFLAPQEFKNIIRYLKIYNIQNVKGRKLLNLFFDRKKISSQRRAASSLAACRREREFILLSLYKYVLNSPLKKGANHSPRKPRFR